MKSKSLFIGLGLGAIGGFIASEYMHTCPSEGPYQIKNDVISYNGQNPRPIMYEGNAIKVGTLDQRVGDLVYHHNKDEVREVVDRFLETELLKVSGPQ